jgi:hypothetical protein
MSMGPGNTGGSAISLEKLIPIKKSGSSDYQPVIIGLLVQVNEATETIHPVIPTPYTLLSLIPSTAKAFTGLDLKDAFFCL